MIQSPHRCSHVPFLVVLGAGRSISGKPAGAGGHGFRQPHDEARKQLQEISAGSLQIEAQVPPACRCKVALHNTAVIWARSGSKPCNMSHIVKLLQSKTKMFVACLPLSQEHLFDNHDNVFCECKTRHHSADSTCSLRPGAGR